MEQYTERCLESYADAIEAEKARHAKSYADAIARWKERRARNFCSTTRSEIGKPFLRNTRARETG
jgi:hypothetical protein